MARESDYILGEILMQLHDLEEKIRELQRQTYAEAWEEGEKEGRGCRNAENILSSPDDKIEDEEDRIIADQAYQEYLDSNCESTPIEDFWKELDSENVTGSEVLLHVQPKQLNEVDLPKIEDMPMPAPAPTQPKPEKRMCPTCHGKIVTCIRQDGRKFECCERSRYNINIVDRASRGDCKGWYQELDD